MTTAAMFFYALGPEGDEEFDFPGPDEQEFDDDYDD